MKPTPPPTIDRARVEALVREALSREQGGGAAGAAARAREVDTAGALLLTPDRGVNVGEPYDPPVMARVLASTPARVGVGASGRATTPTRCCASAPTTRPRRTLCCPRSIRSCSRSSGSSRSRRAPPTRRRSCSGPTSGARCPTRGAPRSTKRISRAPTLVVIYGDGLSAAAINQHLAEFHGALERALAARGIGHAPPFFVRRSRVKVMDEIARLVGAQAALFVCGERPGLGFADSLSAYYIYQPAAGATDADREVISNINPRGRPPADAAGDVAAAIERILREKKSGVILARRDEAGPAAAEAARPGGAHHPGRAATIWRRRWGCRPGGARWASSRRRRTTRCTRRWIRGPRRRPPTSCTRSRSTRAPAIRGGRFRASASASTPARDPAEIDAALDACIAYLDKEAWFYGIAVADDPDRPVALFPARHRVGGALPGAAGGHRARQPAGVPDRAAAGVGGGPGRRVQGGARAHGEVVRPAVGDELRRRLPGRRSAVVRGGGARVRGGDRGRVRGAAGPAVGARRRRERPASRRARRRRRRRRAGEVPRARHGRALHRPSPIT